MESDESVNRSAFLHSFSAYSDKDTDIEIINNEEKNDSNSPMATSMKQVMNYKIKSNVPFSNVVSVAKLLNSQPNPIVQIPNNKASLLKKNASMRFTREFILICSKCKTLCNENAMCGKCKCIIKKQKSNFVVKIPIEQQIKYLVNKNFDIILNHMNRKKINTDISDIDDGLLCKKLSKENSDIPVTLTMNSDGAPLYKSSKMSMWPIQLYANFLPPNIRFKSENILLCMLYIGEEKPDFTELFYPLAMEVNQLQEKKMKFSHNETVYTFVPIVMLGAFDLPARAMASGLKQYSGEKSCVYCLHSGKQVVDHLGQKYIRYVRTNAEVENRNHHGVVSAIANFKSNNEYGLKNIPPMFLFKNFDLTNGFVIDYMHNIVLGVTKLLINLWLGDHRVTKKKAPISPKNRRILDQRLVKLKPCSYVTRKPRPLHERGSFKAIEYRYLLLFYLRFALNGLIDNSKIKHFEQLSAATFILLKSKISETEALEASEMLIKFADQFEIIYGQAAVSMNVHILRHYGSSVLQCGPLWAYSMFGFEKNIGTLKKSVYNPTDALDTITFDYCLKRNESEAISIENVTKMKRKVSLTPKEEEILVKNNIHCLPNGHFEVSDSIEFNNHVFKSKKSRSNKSIDYFVLLKDDSIGCVQFFVKNHDSVFLLIELYKMVDKHYHLLRIKPTSEYELFNSNQIYCKLLYMKFGSFEIVSNEPNFFETT